MTARRNLSAAVALAALAWAQPLAACFQVDCRDWDPGAMAAPPQLQRPPLPAQVMAPGSLGWGVHWGLNTDSSIAGQNEASTWFRASLGDSGIEPVLGFAGPNFIPYMDLRVQLLGLGWTYGPFATLELGGDLMPSRHIGLAFGAALGPLSPFVSARIGRSLDKNYVEGSAGVALSLRDGLSLNAGVARRLNLEDYGDRLANTATLALDWQVGPSSRSHDDADEPRPSRRERRRRARQDDADESQDPAPAAATAGGKDWPSPPADKAAAPAATAASDDPCAFGSTLDAFDPARWEARARCLDTLGRSKEADQARARAKELRDKDQKSGQGN
ncbi:MAG TPA: hypothetical protein VK842_03240 [bacterium]|jgi:hypothetical protein|nr:hypothetical protein [bacterium]